METSTIVAPSRLNSARTSSVAARTSLADAVEALALSGRGFDRALKVARTLADLEGAATVERQHVSEALVFRAPSHQEPPTVIGAGVG